MKIRKVIDDKISGFDGKSVFKLKKLLYLNKTRLTSSKNIYQIIDLI